MQIAEGNPLPIFCAHAGHLIKLRMESDGLGLAQNFAFFSRQNVKLVVKMCCGLVRHSLRG